MGFYSKSTPMSSSSRDFVCCSKKRALQLGKKTLRTLVGLFTEHYTLRSNIVTVRKDNDHTNRQSLEKD